MKQILRKTLVHLEEALICNLSTLFILLSEAMKEEESLTLNTPMLYKVKWNLQLEVITTNVIYLEYRQENCWERSQRSVCSQLTRLFK